MKIQASLNSGITRGIVAYVGGDEKGKVAIIRAFAGQTESIITNNWFELVNFLTEDKGKSLHVCWNLWEFVDSILSLLPPEEQKNLEANPKAIIGNTKIFNTSRLFGITKTEPKESNFIEMAENNFYGLSHWLPPDTPRPTTAKNLEELAYQVLYRLKEMNIYPDKLTSPAGALIDCWGVEGLPTVFSFNPDWLEAMLWADRIAKYEWVAKYKKDKETHSWDMPSAYPSYMVNLPDTDRCIAKHSREWIPADWGILKGEINVTKDITPLNPKAEYFTTEEIEWLAWYKAGTFKFEEGWFFNFLTDNKPYREMVSKLLYYKNTGNDMVRYLAKQMSVGLSGKLDQQNMDGSLGWLYNPVYATMVRLRCRLAVGKYIYDNRLQDKLVSVVIDGVKWI